MKQPILESHELINAKVEQNTFALIALTLGT